MKIAAIVLTLNEERHLARCLESIRGVVDEVLVVDCYSSDSTVDLARKLGARVLQRAWTNHSDQFNYALTQVGDDVDWVLRIDADEYFTPALALETRERLPGLKADVAGVYLSRRMAFMGRMIRHGGIFPVKVIRLFRRGAGRCENRWMDEHIIVKGGTISFEHEIIDDNMKSVTWWVNKHNNYASREVVDLLNREYRFMPADSGAGFDAGSHASGRRWAKDNLYARLPAGLRAFAYFGYRYFLRLGFLDGYEGTAFHVLQGFWYRYLVDVKLIEVKKYMRDYHCTAREGINEVLGIDLKLEDEDVGQACQ